MLSGGTGPDQTPDPKPFAVIAYLAQEVQNRTEAHKETLQQLERAGIECGGGAPVREASPRPPMWPHDALDLSPDEEALYLVLMRARQSGEQDGWLKAREVIARAGLGETDTTYLAGLLRNMKNRRLLESSQQRGYRLRLPGQEAAEA
jgi:uncharacterized protein YjhX (UPF0386 family)